MPAAVVISVEMVQVAVADGREVSVARTLSMACAEAEVVVTVRVSVKLQISSYTLGFLVMVVMTRKAGFRFVPLSVRYSLRCSWPQQ